MREWKPTPRQEDFLEIPDTIFEGMYGGAAGGGKTETLLMLPLVKKDKKGKPLYEHPRFKMLYMRRTFPELDSEVIPRSRDFYPSTGALPFNESKHRWTWPNGAIVQFGHCEHEKDVKKYDTAEYNIIAFDEATSFTAYQYEYLTFSRCRTSSADLPAIVRSGTNPGNIGHSYFRKRFVEPHRTGNVILRENRKGETLLRIFIPSKATDNTYLMAADPGYITRMDRLPEKERLAKKDGDWWTFSGQVFDDFREVPLMDEPEWAKHVVEPFRIPDYWPRVLSIDWGFSALTVAGWYAINPCPSPAYRAKIYKYREYVTRRQKISTWAADIARLSKNETYIDVVLDPSAWGHRGDELTIAEQFHNHSGLNPRKADNERLSGKLLIQEYLRTQDRPARVVPAEGYDHELALKILRIKGPDGLAEYTSLFAPEPAEILPQVQIFNTCPGIIEHLPLCVYDEVKKEDVAELKNDTDDHYDEFRYGIKACQQYLDSGKAAHERVTEIADVCSRVEQYGNTPSAITKFYIDMGNIEAREQRGMQARVTRMRGSRLKGANF